MNTTPTNSIAKTDYDRGYVDGWAACIEWANDVRAVTNVPDLGYQLKLMGGAISFLSLVPVAVTAAEDYARAWTVMTTTQSGLAMMLLFFGGMFLYISGSLASKRFQREHAARKAAFEAKWGTLTAKT